ncbi:hypothetical protein VNO78_21030 [Psophocarpus tetragonolobus]|uniref:Uncharacterized protein n=1 Tax=Psophocarpus tetragonolobus TaxID=3891 RepID=A0AAN9XHA5_PSOTE
MVHKFPHMQSEQNPNFINKLPHPTCPPQVHPASVPTTTNSLTHSATTSPPLPSHQPLSNGEGPDSVSLSLTDMEPQSSRLEFLCAAKVEVSSLASLDSAVVDH